MSSIIWGGREGGLRMLGGPQNMCFLKHCAWGPIIVQGALCKPFTYLIFPLATAHILDLGLYEDLELP